MLKKKEYSDAASWKVPVQKEAEVGVRKGYQCRMVVNKVQESRVDSRLSREHNPESRDQRICQDSREHGS